MRPKSPRRLQVTKIHPGALLLGTTAAALNTSVIATRQFLSKAMPNPGRQDLEWQNLKLRSLSLSSMSIEDKNGYFVGASRRRSALRNRSLARLSSPSFSFIFVVRYVLRHKLVLWSQRFDHQQRRGRLANTRKHGTRTGPGTRDPGRTDKSQLNLNHEYKRSVGEAVLQTPKAIWWQLCPGNGFIGEE